MGHTGCSACSVVYACHCGTVLQVLAFPGGHVFRCKTHGTVQEIAFAGLTVSRKGKRRG